jgi:hypothetical protein
MRHGPAAGLLLLLACGSTALSSDITTTNGTVYRDARVTTVDPDGLHIVHKFGVAKVPFEELSAALRAKYHYDKQKADAYRQQIRARQRSLANKSATTQPQAQAAQPTGTQPPGQSMWRRQPGPGNDFPKRKLGIVAIIVSYTVLFAFLGLAIALYFLPTIIGLRKQNAGGIFLLNLLLGWTLAGWIAALRWACTADSRLVQAKSVYH